MKQLYLMRHAKSSWDVAASDRERELNKRGRRDAPRMGEALAQMLPAQTIHVSPARRAQLTLGGLCDGWPELEQFSHVTQEPLYTFSADQLVRFIQAQPNTAELFLLGHNPALTDLVNWSCADFALENLPTAGFVHLSLDVTSWAALDYGCGRLQTQLFPKQLGAS